MAKIECNEISQTINELLISFQNCKKINNEDLVKLVELIAAVNVCNDGGPRYNTLVSESYSPIEDTTITYPIDTYHSLNIMIIDGNITRDISMSIVTFPTGTVLNHEVTTLNQTEYKFTIKAGSIVVVEYLIETI